jgi:hypothetical protein
MAPLMSLKQAAGKAVFDIVGALNDEDAAHLIAQFCHRRPSLREKVLHSLSPVVSGSDVDKQSPDRIPVAQSQAKKVRRAPSFSRGKCIMMPTPGSNGGEYMDLAVHLLSGKQVASIGVYDQDCLAAVKAAIEDAEGTPACQQQLMIDDYTLEDQEIVKQYCWPLNSSGQASVTMVRRDPFFPPNEDPGPGYILRDGDYGMGYYARETVGVDDLDHATVSSSQNQSKPWH